MVDWGWWSGFVVLRRDKNAKGGPSDVEEPPFAWVGGMVLVWGRFWFRE